MIRKRRSHDVRTASKFNTIERLTRRTHAGVAFLAQMIDPKAAANSNWFFQKIFGEGEFIAAGQMHIPPKSQKPSKSTKDNTYVRRTLFRFSVRAAVTWFFVGVLCDSRRRVCFHTRNELHHYYRRDVSRSPRFVYSSPPLSWCPKVTLLLGNTYYIENIAERDAKLFFTQARMLPVEDGMQVQHTAQSAPPLSHRRAISEDVSAGPRKSTRKA